jgi:hypothetical protein
MVAARLILDRLWPVPKGHLIHSEKIPEVASAADVLRTPTNLTAPISG